MRANTALRKYVVVNAVVLGSAIVVVDDVVGAVSGAVVDVVAAVDAAVDAAVAAETAINLNRNLRPATSSFSSVDLRLTKLFNDLFDTVECSDQHK